MAAKSTTLSPPHSFGTGSVLVWLFGLVSFGLLLFLILRIAMQIATPPPAHRLVFVEDVALPGVLPNNLMPFPGTPSPSLGPLSPGVALRFDHFDFQTLDPNTKLLFIAHSGPAPDKEELVNHNFKADRDAAVDGHVLVFDTMQNKLVGRVDIPQVAGIVAAPDLGEAFAADANDNLIYVFNEHTLQITAKIPLGDNESPDAMEYDPIDQKVFVSDPGAPNPDVIDRQNQNVTVIDAKAKKVITKINVGNLPKLPGESADPQKPDPQLGDPKGQQLGYDVGHNHYDRFSHHLYVTLQQLPHDPNALSPVPGTGELAEIDPVTYQVLRRVQLPTTCSTPHGMTLDGQQHEAFIVCVDVNPDNNSIPNLMRVDIQSMKVIPDDPKQLVLAAKPDIAVIDQSQHVIFIGCAGGVSVFDESNGQLKKLGTYQFGKNTHTLAVNETTNLLYLPQPDIGGRPALRIVKYDPNATA